MRLLAIAFLSVLVLSGCEKTKNVKVNLDYASTSLGYRNSGLLTAGSLFFWDVENNRLTLLSEDVELKDGQRTPKSSFEAKNVDGIELSATGGLPDDVDIAIKGEIKDDYFYSVSNAVSVKSKHIYASISKEYRRLRADGVNVISAWRVDDLVSNPTRYKLVLARSPVYADSESLSFKRGSNGSITLKLPKLKDTTFKVGSQSEVAGKCSGQQALCYIKLSVLNVKLVTKADQNGQQVRNLDYEPAINFDPVDLPEALRKIN